MQRLANHTAAFVVAIMIAATSFTAVTSMPADAQSVLVSTTVLA